MTTTAPAGRRLADTGEALWRRLADDLRRRLADGEFGRSFPGELALAADYGVSRHTVREALRDLRAEGLVTSARGRPSRVGAPTLIEQPSGGLYSLFTSVLQAGLTQRSVVRARDIVTDPAVAAELGLAADAELFHLERLRLAGDRPLAVDRVWLPADRTRALAGADFAETSLYRQLQEVCGIVVTSGSERVRAAVPGAEVRAVLGIDDTVATLAIDRMGFDGARPVERRHTILRGDLFSLTTHYPRHPATPGAS